MDFTRKVCAASYRRRIANQRRQCSEKTALFFRPMIAPILQDPMILRILSALALIQLLVTLLGVQGWQCPVKGSVGLACPGCGLSTAMVALILGDWQTAFSIHAFAPLFVMALILMVLLSFLPRRFNRIIVERLAALERNRGVTVLFLIAFFGYWGVRFIL